jgi:hypothetical protein
MALYSSSATSIDLAQKLRELASDGEPTCQCREPADNDQGTCMECGLWINYRERDDR